MGARGTVQTKGVSVGDELDAALVCDVARGDEDAFQELYLRHAEYMHRVARKFFADSQLIGSAVSNAFLKAHDAIMEDKFNPARGTFNIWITGILRNYFISLHKQQTKKAKRQVSLERRRTTGWEPAHDSSLEEQVITKDLIAFLLSRLPPHLHETVARVLIDQMKVTEAAKAANKPTKTVRKQLARGKQLLRDLLRGGVEDDHDR
jgi:RNA polymerase sigma factor (sigma-70 family)